MPLPKLCPDTLIITDARNGFRKSTNSVRAQLCNDQPSLSARVSATPLVHRNILPVGGIRLTHSSRPFAKSPQQHTAVYTTMAELWKVWKNLLLSIKYSTLAFASTASLADFWK